MKTYTDFSKFAIAPEYSRFLNACYQAGAEWYRQGHDKLPRLARVGGKKIPVVGSSGDAAHEFVKGWRAAKQGRLAVAA